MAIDYADLFRLLELVRMGGVGRLRHMRFRFALMGHRILGALLRRPSPRRRRRRRRRLRLLLCLSAFSNAPSYAPWSCSKHAPTAMLCAALLVRVHIHARARELVGVRGHDTLT